MVRWIESPLDRCALHRGFCAGIEAGGNSVTAYETPNFESFGRGSEILGNFGDGLQNSELRCHWLERAPLATNLQRFGDFLATLDHVSQYLTGYQLTFRTASSSLAA
jgi:hypothetical protein